ncbi:hypothetical protein RRG08_059356 [Elysia crispata]|uniref:C-type lectin domain-containing protein n=1 Tax=Elysia crispata TaxID=231223 RepID=A0AAE1BFJ0_9GAST|nr:hypothetical protein RRG08_059356 [Elysia crispata]
MPKSDTINTIFRSTLARLKIHEPVWIGISERAKEGQFVHVDGSDCEIKKVDEDSSNPSLGSEQDCWALDPTSGKWSRSRCDNAKYFICRYF